MTAIEILRDVGERCGALGTVVSWHAFRPPGRARGIEQHGEILRSGSRTQRAAGSRPVVEPAGAILGVTNRNTRQISRPPGPGNRVNRNRVEDDGAGSCIGKTVIELLGLHAPVERGHDDPEELAGPMEARHLEAVLQDDGEPVAPPEAKRRKPLGNAPNLCIPFGIGELTLAVDDGQRVRAALDTRKKATAEIKHRVPL